MHCINGFYAGQWRPSVRAGLARALLKAWLRLDLGEGGPCPGADVKAWLGWAGWVVMKVDVLVRGES